jgi:hypothetical protein
MRAAEKTAGKVEMIVASGSREQAHFMTASELTERPLLVDVEHGLLQCNIEQETLISSSKVFVSRLIEILGDILQCRAPVKSGQGEAPDPDLSTLPLNLALVELIGREAARGRPIHLLIDGATFASGDGLLKRLPFVTGTITRRELSGPHASSAVHTLTERFPTGFAYAVGPAAKPEMWQQASSAVLIGGTVRDRKRIAALTSVSAHIPRPWVFHALLKGLRLHQWTKNLLVFAPFILGGAIKRRPGLAGDPDRVRGHGARFLIHLSRQ